MSCSVSGCGGSVWAAKLCSRHYNRLRTTGTTDDGPRARLSVETRFWRSVRRAGPNECWEWVGKSRLAGYGYISLGGRGAGKVLAHRLSWQIHRGELPRDGGGYHGAVVMHTCDNRLCVNPTHLRLGTQTENVRDMDAKGRRKVSVRLGSDHHKTTVTEADVRFIRSSKLSNRELGERFSMTRHGIAAIRRRTTWKHVK